MNNQAKCRFPIVESPDLRSGLSLLWRKFNVLLAGSAEDRRNAALRRA
jgi:hypothetical protein